MTRRKQFKYPMWIYVNNQRNKVELDVECKDGHWTATFADLKATGSYFDAIAGVRDAVIAVINQQLELQKQEAARQVINA